MPTLTQIIIGIAVIIFLSFSNTIWYYIKRMIFKPDIQKLMDARDIKGLRHALSYKKEKDDLYYIRTNAAIALGNVGDTKVIDKLLEGLNDIDRKAAKACIQAIGQITLRCVRQPMIEAYQNRDQLRLQSLLSLLQNIQLKAIPLLVNVPQDTSELQLVVSTLGIISGPAAFDFIQKSLLGSRDSKVRKTAFQALISTGDPRMNDTFIKLLSKSDSDLQVSSAEILGNLKESRAKAPLGKLLEASNSSVRKAAVEALGKIGDPGTGDRIIYILSDSLPEIRKTAAAVLAGMGDNKWEQWVKGEDNDFNRVAASGEPQAFDILIKALDNQMAIPALGLLGDKRAVEPLIAKLGDDNENMRLNAANTLGKLGDTKAIEPLIALMNDNNAQVRKEAAEALDKLGRSEWVQWVKGDKSDINRMAQSRDPRVFDILIKTQDNEKAILALGAMGDKRAVEPLIKKLENEESNIKIAAINALETLGDKRAVEPLIKKLESDEYKVKMAAINALETLGDTRAAEPIRKLLVDWDTDIRKKAVIALKKLGEPKWKDFIKGESCDFERLVYADDGYIVTQSIERIMRGLYSGQLSSRQSSAQFLVKLAANPPAELKNFWKEIHKQITTPHNDGHMDVDSNRSSDCSHNDYHTDTGIGLSFPAARGKIGK